jgi:hypothetical protein
MDFVTVRDGPISLNVAVEGEGPLIACVHGWPKLWYDGHARPVCLTQMTREASESTSARGVEFAAAAWFASPG